MRVSSILFLFLALLIAACTTNTRIFRPVETISFTGQIETAEPIVKAMYSGRSNTVYAMAKDWQQIHFFRALKRINSIGGMGLDRTSFQKLSDISVDSDGSLLALDTIARKIRKFSPDGMWAGDMDIKASAQPELFARAGDQTLFVYDSLSGEVICFSPLDNAEQYRFGKFQLYRISNLSLSRNYVVAYSASDNSSHIYSRLGQYIGSEPGQIVYDDFDNSFILERQTLRSGNSVYSLPQMQRPVLSLNLGVLCIATDTRIILLKPIYEGR